MVLAQKEVVRNQMANAAGKKAISVSVLVSGSQQCLVRSHDLVGTGVLGRAVGGTEPSSWREVTGLAAAFFL